MRAQIASIREVEPDCSCGCPSFTPVIDKTTAPPTTFHSILPTELIEGNRTDGIPRTVIWFADSEGYIANIKCVYYDDAMDEWPQPDDCELAH